MSSNCANYNQIKVLQKEEKKLRKSNEWREVYWKLIQIERRCKPLEVGEVSLKYLWLTIQIYVSFPISNFKLPSALHNICPTLRLIPNLPNILSVQFFNQFFSGLPKRKYILICLSYFPWHFKAHWSPTYGFNLSCSSGIINPQATPRPQGNPLSLSLGYPILF